MSEKQKKERSISTEANRFAYKVKSPSFAVQSVCFSGPVGASEFFCNCLSCFTTVKITRTRIVIIMIVFLSLLNNLNGMISVFLK